MGERNYLVEGASGAGKTTVAVELERRGYHVVHGDRVLARTGDPVTGRLLEEPIAGWSPEQRHRHHIWDTDQVQTLVADNSHPLTFFCGGSRNSASFVDLFDEVFVLEVDGETLHRRLDARPGEFGNLPEERALVLRLHRTGEDLPIGGVSIDATRSVTDVVDDILRHVEGSATTTETGTRSPLRGDRGSQCADHRLGPRVDEADALPVSRTPRGQRRPSGSGPAAPGDGRPSAG